MEIQEPNLEAVFLHLTGKALRAHHQEAADCGDGVGEEQRQPGVELRDDQQHRQRRERYRRLHAQEQLAKGQRDGVLFFFGRH